MYVIRFKDLSGGEMAIDLGLERLDLLVQIIHQTRVGAHDRHPRAHRKYLVEVGGPFLHHRRCRRGAH